MQNERVRCKDYFATTRIFLAGRTGKAALAVIPLQDRCEAFSSAPSLHDWGSF